GGETAEMPGVYAAGKLDVVGTIVGLVERDAVIDGSSIRPGDQIIGLPSSGLHTNGYSLVSAIWPPDRYGRHVPDLGRTLGEALVEPHRSYLPAVRAIQQGATVKGLAHITGGGYPDNLPRILPQGIGVVIERSTWEVPALFQMIEREGQIDHDEMYRVFNMGMGMVVFVAADQANAALAAAGPGARIIGRAVAAGDDAQRVVLA
ncbi:MAG: phosphoribosylformylglycinamidine cyclo-ligase, partial [Anaerolineales bacterium]|nr:phosphoribosylformylglycinamidine cyclo-ligase [Anaerolineales bacterium]